MSGMGFVISKLDILVPYAIHSHVPGIQGLMETTQQGNKDRLSALGFKMCIMKS
jgi:hypothetical protein